VANNVFLKSVSPHTSPYGLESIETYFLYKELKCVCSFSDQVVTLLWAKPSLYAKCVHLSSCL